MIAAILQAEAPPVVRTSTLGSWIGDERLELPLDYSGFLRTLRTGVDRGGRYAVLELTSEALAHGFCKAWPCQIGVFTNLTEDHLKFHKTFEHYLASKAQLFLSLLPNGTAVLNADDPCSDLLAEVVPPHARVLRAGFRQDAPVRGSNIRVSVGTTSFSVDGELGSADVRIPLIGRVFAANALAAIAAASALGIPLERSVSALATFRPPPGRFEVVHTSPTVIIDFAHTPDAMARTVTQARELCTGKLWLVFGAGGNRDAEKRPRMGSAAASADRIVLTSDNPRDESAEAIATAIRAGLQHHTGVSVELDRFAAIRLALQGAAPDDWVLIAGKGHETGQEISGILHPFSDHDAVQACLK